MTSPDALSDRIKALPAPVQGALLMTAAAFCFSIMNVLIREVSSELDPLQIAFFRNFFALAFMLPWVLRAGLGGLKTRHPRIHLCRALIGMVAMIAWFYSIALLPLAEAVALNFTVPLFATAGAAVFLGEVVRLRRWTATALGFLGVLVILRPGFAEVTPTMALPVLAAAFMASSVLMVKSLSRSESASTIVVLMNLILTPLSLVPALFVWRWPSLTALALVMMIGLLAAAAHLLLTRSYTKADASAVIPFDYARLPFVALLAFVLFGEVPDAWTWAGAGIIAASAIYIAHREAQVAKVRPASGAAGHSPAARP